MAQAHHFAESEYVTALAALVKADPTRLSTATLQRLAEVFSDPSLDGRAAEDRISDLAQGDDALAVMWDDVQKTEPMATRAPETVAVQRRNYGPTHRWICPVDDCPTDEPGLEWAPSTITHCRRHGKKLVRRRIPASDS